MTSRNAAVSRCCATRSPSRSSCAARSAAKDVPGAARNPVRPGLLRDAGEQRAAEPVVLQQPVPVGAEDGPGVGALTGPVEQHRIARPHHAPVVDLVAARPGAPRRPRRGLPAPCRRELDLQVEQAEPLGRAALDPVRIRDPPPEHLVATADPEHGPPGRRVCDHRVGQPAAAQPPEVRNGRLRARQHDEVRALDPRRLGDVAHRDPRLARQRLGVRRVRDPREPHDRHPHPLRTVRWRRPPEHPVGHRRERVLRVEPQPVRPRHHAERRAAGQRPQLVQPRREQRRVAAELVDDEPRDPRLVRGRRARRPCRTGARAPRRGRCRRPPPPAGPRPAPAPCSRCRWPAG